MKSRVWRTPPRTATSASRVSAPPLHQHQQGFV
uniref:Uncharacterized protein n=1 Tax=Arundo donax TaxID=35708 RepID=A0A0A9CIH0_ARUDO